MKIAYLEGALLDYWVAKAQDLRIDGVRNDQLIVGAAPDLEVFSPSSNWAQAGPIIEVQQIDLICDFGRWMARHGKHEEYSRPSEQPLVAAMRAYLMWEYGDEVPTTPQPQCH